MNYEFLREALLRAAIGRETRSTGAPPTLLPVCDCWNVWIAHGPAKFMQRT